ncbi:hypothetical protein [Microbispora triticiradicis]|uniref:hypothetical protein n=1 Tax=Microbispora triticiradicis TaxID=2200763 RepID=UPI0014048BE5|nr:hypothetical protein [Microbispora triticiradicis]
MDDTEAETPSSTDAGHTSTGRGAWRANVLAGLGSVADITAIAQLIVSGSRQWIFVAGLLSILAGLLGFIQLFRRPIGVRAMVMVLLIGTGAAVTGATTEQYLNERAAGSASSADAASSSPSSSSAPPSSAGDAASVGAPPSSGTTPAPGATPTPSVATPLPTTGQVLHEAKASLKDQDYLDAETGMIGEVRPRASDVWYVSPYRELWTAGGGALPITRVDGRPDAGKCADALTTRDYDLVEVGEMKAGDWACARTAEGNLLAVQISAVPTGDAPLEISYVVWQK